jgi:dTDP-4-amino-4,6-dideoxygalactose transaminase
MASVGMITVTKPFLPPKEEYLSYVHGIWDRNLLTNNGPLVNDLEARLRSFLNVKHLLFLGNGTIALQIAIKALKIKGKVITTPFSYVATTSSIVWEGCDPIFVDIDPFTFNLDPAKIEERITSDTSAILATHVFGNPCDARAIGEIARCHKLKLIFDGAHAFGTRHKGESVFNFGDIATASFHATKLFHTVEGGAVVTGNENLLEEMAWLRNFGHHGPEEFRAVGINGKNSEFHAAMGLANLNHISEIIYQRRELCGVYDESLDGLHFRKQKMAADTEYNYAYYPVVFESETQVLKAMANLNANNIYPRRYFWPSLNTISYTRGKYTAEISEDISRRILCLPLYHGLKTSEVRMISELLLKTQNS